MARIVSVADVFDALISNRPYKSGWTNERAYEFLEKKSGKHFDPDCVTAFLERPDDVIKIQQELKDRKLFDCNVKI